MQNCEIPTKAHLTILPVFSWVVSRTRQLPDAAREQVNQVINSLVELNSLYYQVTDQSDASCFYIPETVDGDSIVFGGQCDLNIPVVNNFQAGDVSFIKIKDKQYLLHN